MTLTRVAIKLRSLEVLGYEQLTMFGESEVAAEMYCDEDLDGKEFGRYLDRSVSVSGLVEVEDDFAIWPTDLFTDEQYRRFLNGS